MLSETLQPISAESTDDALSEKRLGAVRVANEVEWVNPDINLPLDLSSGTSTDVAVMVIPQTSSLEKDTEVLGLYRHHRSVLIGRSLFTDKQGVTYRDIDSKGSGYVDLVWGSKELVGHGIDGEDFRGTRGKGLLELGSAHMDQAFGEIFSEAGIRVVRAIAVIKLKELVDADGHKISLEEARERGILEADFEPAIELRAFGTRARIGDTANHLKDAMVLVAQELGVEPESFTAKDYILWFAETLGEQMRKIHELGFTHGGLHHNNLTLDCRLVDFDSAHTIPYDYDERGDVIYGEGAHLWQMLAQNFRYELVEVFPEIGQPSEDDLDRAIKAAYEKGYGELTDELVYGHEMESDYDEEFSASP